jgi:hypothetical protein
MITVVEGDLECLQGRRWIGAGSGGFDIERPKGVMLDELRSIDYPLKVILVLYRK